MIKCIIKSTYKIICYNRMENSEGNDSEKKKRNSWEYAYDTQNFFVVHIKDKFHHCYFANKI